MSILIKNVVFDLCGVLVEYLPLSRVSGYPSKTFTLLDPGIEILQTVVNACVFDVYACTNMSERNYAILEKEHPALVNNFKGVVTSARAQAAKPHPDIFHFLRDTYALDPCHTLFLDDDAMNVRAARNLGMHALVVHDFEAVKKELQRLGIF